MRLVTIALMAGLVAAPALAQTPAPANDTIKIMLEKGAVWTIMGFEGEIIYTPDGKWTGFDGQASGSYTVDGNKLCTNSDQGSACAVYPDGKKSGDTFVITLDALGDVDVKIK